MAQYLAKLLSN